MADNTATAASQTSSASASEQPNAAAPLAAVSAEDQHNAAPPLAGASAEDAEQQPAKKIKLSTAAAAPCSTTSAAAFVPRAWQRQLCLAAQHSLGQVIYVFDMHNYQYTDEAKSGKTALAEHLVNKAKTAWMLPTNGREKQFIEKKERRNAYIMDWQHPAGKLISGKTMTTLRDLAQGKFHGHRKCTVIVMKKLCRQLQSIADPWVGCIHLFLLDDCFYLDLQCTRPCVLDEDTMRFTEAAAKN